MNSIPLVGWRTVCRYFGITFYTLLDYIDLGILMEPWRGGEIIAGWPPYEIYCDHGWLPTAEECRELLQRDPYPDEE